MTKARTDAEELRRIMRVLGPEDGARFERLALLNGYREDFADFATLVMRKGLDELEREYEAEAAAARDAQKNAPAGGDLDDGIPW